MSKNVAVAPAKRPDLHDEDPLWDRQAWRVDVTMKDTQLGYWEWVMHQYENGGRHLPQEVAEILTPYDLWGMPHAISEMPEAARLVSALAGIIKASGFNEDQWDLIAEKMCLSSEALNKVLDLAEKRHEEIIKSVEDHNL